MKIFYTIRMYLLIIFFTVVCSSPFFGQQQNTQQERLKARGTDSIPATIFPPRKVLTEEEKRAEQLYASGSKKGKAGDYKGAIEDFTESISLIENANSYMKRGFAYLFSGNFPLAIQDFTEVQRLAPANREAIFGLGVARFEMRDYAAAEVDLKQYLDLVHINEMAFNYMAALCFLRQDFQCALENYTNVIRRDSLYPDAFVNRAMIRHYLRDYKGAMQDYDVAVNQTPDDPKVYNNRGATKMMLKDLPGALEDFSHAIKLDPTYADAYNNRGRVRHAQGDAQGACSDWHKALTFGIEASRELIIKYCK